MGQQIVTRGTFCAGSKGFYQNSHFPLCREISPGDSKRRIVALETFCRETHQIKKIWTDERPSLVGILCTIPEQSLSWSESCVFPYSQGYSLGDSGPVWVHNLLQSMATHSLPWWGVTFSVWMALSTDGIGAWRFPKANSIFCWLHLVQVLFHGLPQ